MSVVFWILAPIMVVSAMGLVLARKAVHCALLLATVMVSLAILYAAQGAPFLFAVQIIVYTGAILMLFLFVLMLVGVDSSDSVVETIKGQRAWAIVVGLIFGATFAAAIAQTSFGVVVGLDEANADGNVYGIAALLFSPYIFAFEITGALLTVAVLGAMIFAHKERLIPKVSQRELALRRMQDYGTDGKHPGPLPTPGVYARHNAVDTPALLPDGSISELSISRALQARGDVRDALRTDVSDTLRKLDPDAPNVEPADSEGPPAPDGGLSDAAVSGQASSPEQEATPDPTDEKRGGDA